MASMEPKDILIACFWCVVFGSSTASIVALRKHATLAQVGLIVISGIPFYAGIPFAIISFTSLKWYAAIPASIAVGWFIYGIWAWQERNEQRIRDIELSDYLPSWPKKNQGDKQ